MEKTGTAEEEALPVKTFGDVRTELGCMYVIDLVKEAFMADPVFAYGHNDKQTLEITQLKGPDWEFGETIELPGAHGEEVVRDLKFVDASNVLSCGEDGLVKLWAIGGGEGAEAGKSAGSVSKKSKRKSKKEERFAPY